MAKMTHEEKMARPYRLYDAYEGMDIVGNYKTKREMNRAYKEYEEDCDGEWYPIKAKYNPDTKKYDRI